MSCLPFDPASVVTSASINTCITCRPAPTANASKPSRMLSAISAIATLTRSSDAVAPTGWIWLLFFTAVPLLSVCLGGRPTPTTRQVSSGGPPPQLLRDPGQPLRAVVQCQMHDLVDFLLRDRLLPTPALADLRELDQPLLGEPGAPPADRRWRHRHRPRDSRVRQTVGRHQQSSRPDHLAMRRRRRPRHGLENLTLPRGNQQSRNGSPHVVKHTKKSPIN